MKNRTQFSFNAVAGISVILALLIPVVIISFITMELMTKSMEETVIHNDLILASSNTGQIEQFIKLESALQIVNQVKMIFLVSAIAVFIVVTSAISWGYGKIRQSLVSLMKGADEIAVGNYDTKIKIPRLKEFRALAANFTSMTEKIRSRENELLNSREELKQLNENLEQMVADRTVELRKVNSDLVIAMKTIRETQDQLIISEKMAALGNLVAGVAHEINTPVGIAVTAVSYITKNIREATKFYENGTLKKSDMDNLIRILNESAEITLSNLNHAADLIQNFKKIAVDQSSESKRDFELNSYINDIITSLHPVIKKKDLKIETTSNQTIVINSYPGVFSQILSNLIMNSITHGFENAQHGKIIILLEKSDTNINIVYRDNGIGIKKSNIDKIFDPFFTTKRGEGGSGLGLNIVYNLVTQKLGGHIRCTSEENSGTEFTIAFPYQ